MQKSRLTALHQSPKLPSERVCIEEARLSREHPDVDLSPRASMMFL